jgi:CHAT domain-containing protein
VYLVADTESFAVALTREAARMIRIARNRQDLGRIVMEIRRSVEPEHADETRFAFAAAHGLYRDLLAPLSDLLDAKPVWFVVPDGPLESLPFSLLVKSGVDAGRGLKWHQAPWVVRQHAVVTLPSLGALTLARNTPRPAPAPEALIAFADPILNEAPAVGAASRKARNLKIGALWSGESPKVLTVAETPSRPAGAMTTAGGRRLANPDLVRKLTPLPDTADEARAVAAALGGGELLMRDNATETRLKQSDLSRYRNLLFATHGAMASDFVEFGEPALVLTPPRGASEQAAGRRAASEIAQLKLNADWVLLSACNTAAADGTPGAEGLSGLAKAFFHAGARNLLVSHWSVVSESTVLLSTGTFKRLQQQPAAGKARALQYSILELMDRHEEFRHPMFWAPFVLVGDGR